MSCVTITILSLFCFAHVVIPPFVRTLASMEKSQYVSVVVCFVAFLANDIYGFINWQRMKERQQTIVNVEKTDFAG